MPKRSKALGSAYIGRTLDQDGDVTFQAMERSFERALQSCPGQATKRTFCVAGLWVDLRVIGRELGRILAAPLAHLEAPLPADAIDVLRIDAWDENATGQSCEVLPAAPELTGLGIVVRSPERRFFRLETAHSSTWLDERERRILGWFASSSQLTIDERSKPLYRLLYCTLPRRGINMIHAALVARNGRGALLAGRGGAGKSTSAMSCLAAGLACLGDDYVGLQADTDGKAFIGHSLFSTCCIERSRMASFADLRSLIAGPSHPVEDKVVLTLAERFRGQLPHSVAIATILLPIVTGGSRTTMRPASPIEALNALAPSSLLLMPDPAPEAFSTLARLVECLPSYWLELGGPIELVPAAIIELIDDTGPRSPCRT